MHHRNILKESKRVSALVHQRLDVPMGPDRNHTAGAQSLSMTTRGNPKNKDSSSKMAVSSPCNGEEGGWRWPHHSRITYDPSDHGRCLLNWTGRMVASTFTLIVASRPFWNRGVRLGMPINSIRQGWCEWNLYVQLISGKVWVGFFCLSNPISSLTNVLWSNI